MPSVIRGLLPLLVISAVILAVPPVMAAGGNEHSVGKSSAMTPADYTKLTSGALMNKAAAGDLQAQFELGSRYSNGRGIPRNDREAREWLRRAAGNGHREAQRLLALNLYRGDNVGLAQEEALIWTRHLAEAGDLPGQVMLAYMYGNGEGAERNLVQSYVWYDIAVANARQAAEAGDEAAQSTLDMAIEEQGKTAALLMPEELARAQDIASNWWLNREAATGAGRRTSR